MSTDIHGSIVAIVTPMLDDGSLDLPALDRLLEWHVESGTHAVVVAGTTGESSTLSTQEHCDLVEHCVKSIAGRIPVIAGTGSNNTQEALYLTESAWQHGADAALLVAPYYNRPSQRGMYEHFKLLAESVDIPQILYNVPGRTACDLELDTVDKLAELDNVIAIKDATGDLQRGEQLIERCTDRLAVYSGEDAITFPLMMAGAKGTISVTANTAPALMAQMCDLALAGDGDQAKLIDDKLMMLHNNLFLEGNPVPVKWALARMGLIGSGIRLPLVELDGKYQLQVSEALTAAGISLAASS